MKLSTILSEKAIGKLGALFDEKGLVGRMYQAIKTVK
jgi:hypothetical protein